jgi:transposase
VRYTRKLSRFVWGLSRITTLSDVARITGLSWGTVKAIVRPYLAKEAQRIRYRDLKRLSIDEIYVGKARKFYTLVINLDTGQIVWVAHGKASGCLRPFWRRLRLAKARVEAVSMDMSAAYWKTVRDNLPDAAVVFDRFHIVKLVNDRLDKLRRLLVRRARGIVKHDAIKGTRYLLLARRDALDGDKLQALDAALRENEPLFTAYYLKEELNLLWGQETARAMKTFLRQWCRRASSAGIPYFKSLAKTLLRHCKGIVNWFTHRISSARMEGINNKIRTLTRSAYGYRDEGFFLLKLYNLHHSRQELLG